MRKAFFNGYTIYENGVIMGKYGKEVQPRNNNGRLETRLSINGKRKNFIVQRLVYYVFKGFDIKNQDLCIVAKDGNKLNAHLDNLELVHRKDLIQGEKHKALAKLTDAQVSEIKHLYSSNLSVNQYDKTGMSLQDIADLFSISKGNVASIVKGSSRNPEKYKLK